MKIGPSGLLLVAAVALGLSLAACGCFQQAVRGEKAPPPVPEQKAMTAPEQKSPIAVGNAGATATPPAAVASVAAAMLGDVHFDFDRYSIRREDAKVLKKNYAWFGSNSGKVIIEGNCDERGSIEYNLALGQKRADAAKAYLVQLGVDPKRLETVSYGKEKPADPGHNETAWKKNRRDHFSPVRQ